MSPGAAIEGAKGSGEATAQSRVAEAERFVESLDPAGDLDAMRREIVKHILALRAQPQ
ncbi:MAG: hypothetical protein V2A58_11875 [Planctomycetota bacterium]